jgi:hypothetical protein
MAVRQLEYELNQSLPNRYAVTVWSYTSTPPYICMVKHRDSFTVSVSECSDVCSNMDERRGKGGGV